MSASHVFPRSQLPAMLMKVGRTKDAKIWGLGYKGFVKKNTLPLNVGVLLVSTFHIIVIRDLT